MKIGVSEALPVAAAFTVTMAVKDPLNLLELDYTPFVGKQGSFRDRNNTSLPLLTPAHSPA